MDWIVSVMDLATRFILAWDISDTKEKYDAVPLLLAAKDMADKVPGLFITDGLKQYHIAFKKCSTRYRASGPYTYVSVCGPQRPS